MGDMPPPIATRFRGVPHILLDAARCALRVGLPARGARFGAIGMGGIVSSYSFHSKKGGAGSWLMIA